MNLSNLAAAFTVLIAVYTPLHAQLTTEALPLVEGAKPVTVEHIKIHVPQTIEGAFARGAKEMIVVLPDSKTLHNGSMYSSSVTTGDFEIFIARDVVA